MDPIEYEPSHSSPLESARKLRANMRIAQQKLVVVNHTLLKLHALLRGDDMLKTKQVIDSDYSDLVPITHA